METSANDRISQIKEELEELSKKRKELIKELRSIDVKDHLPLYGSKTVLPYSTPQEKVEFFLKFFRCREDVYPRFWKNDRSGKKGYSPVCQNEWASGICKKPKIKCGDCNYQAFKPFDQKAALDHLQGKEVIGTYTLKGNSQCVFLAAN